MKGFILAAGVGSRLKPWTDYHPKALVPVGGVPMLERVVNKMHQAGIEEIAVNCFHFADQIKDFVKSKNWDIRIFDERPELLETGGAILNAADFIDGEEPILVHNADILSNADFIALKQSNRTSHALATLLVSNRKSSRKLIFDEDMRLAGWHSISSGEFRPEVIENKSGYCELAFSGIYIISPKIIHVMKENGWKDKFPIMDFFLSTLHNNFYSGFNQSDLLLTDVGKPESLNMANAQMHVS